MNIGFELQSPRHYNSHYVLPIVTRIQNWYTEIGATESEVILKIDLRTSDAGFPGGTFTFKEYYTSLTMEFIDINMYHLFRLSVDRKEYEPYIVSETTMITDEELERWKNE